MELESRLCMAEYCDKNFRVLAASTQQYCSKPCAGESGAEWGPKEQGPAAAAERKRIHAYPEGTISALEFAARLGTSAQTVYSWVKNNEIPFTKPTARKTCLVYDEAVKAPVVVQFLRKKNKQPATHPAAIERQQKRIYEKEAYLYAPDDLRPVPSKPAPPPSAEPLFSEPLALRRRVEEEGVDRNGMPLEPPPLPDDCQDHSLAERARKEIASGYVKAAKRCNERKERQAERVLLWHAIEALGLEQIP